MQGKTNTRRWTTRSTIFVSKHHKKVSKSKPFPGAFSFSYEVIAQRVSTKHYLKSDLNCSMVSIFFMNGLDSRDPLNLLSFK